MYIRIVPSTTIRGVTDCPACRLWTGASDGGVSIVVPVYRVEFLEPNLRTILWSQALAIGGMGRIENAEGVGIEIKPTGAPGIVAEGFRFCLWTGASNQGDLCAAFLGYVAFSGNTERESKQEAKRLHKAYRKLGVTPPGPA